MSVEPFVYLVLLLVLMLLSLLMRWLKGEIEEQIQERPTDEWGYERPPVRVRAHEFATAKTEREIPALEGGALDREQFPSSRPPRKSRGRITRLGNLQDVRHGIVLMTILGPCRAFEPSAELRRF